LQNPTNEGNVDVHKGGGGGEEEAVQ